MKTVYIYGDSIMRATVIDEKNSYHASISQYIAEFESNCGVKIENRARFGCTAPRGAEILSRDLGAGVRPDIAVIAYGGNDCNYNWSAVAREPYAEHNPHTPLPQFIETLRAMISELRKNSINPVLTTLPPVSAEKYLAFLDQKGCCAKGILKWLGSADMIYRYHELYSGAVTKLAAAMNCHLVDVRAHFLSCRNYDAQLISRDGIHLQPAGYRIVADAFRDYALQTNLLKSVRPHKSFPCLNVSFSTFSGSADKA